MSVVNENGLLRVRRQPRAIRGEVELTPEAANIIAAALNGGRSRTANRLTLPDKALAAVGVSSTDELSISVEDGNIVLTPARPAEGEACAP